ncbi:MFS transporter [Prodigiosinella confusarubida]|uniref:MFS transporter n=1 Tax=Serratia sp. (strain ATCC 39006) TaxID=104623 RepID=A0A2I5TPZ4_SERS3|nr:MFS transporter [Serratia sp. ATCC 39006]AUH02316.1 MFS transporter [Serratia sp. ATCC 39006]AUH06638.1 MFS transporter [Serratia sp. ATCC 39006]
MITYFILIFATAISALATDMLVPALNIIKEDLSVSYSTVQATISLFLIFFAIGQLLAGYLSDRVKKLYVLNGGMTVFIIGSIICSYADNAAGLLAGRALQAIGASTGPIVARSLAKECYDGKKLQRVIADIATASAVIPLLAPVLGGQMVEPWGWRSLFYFMALFGAVTILLSLFAPFRHQIAAATEQTCNYNDLIHNRAFIHGTLIVTLTFSGLLCFISLSPVIYHISIFSSPAYFSFIFFGAVACYMLGTQLAKTTIAHNVSMVISAQIISGLLFLFSGLFFPESLSLLIIAGIVFNIASGAIYPQGHTQALNVNIKIVGTATAITGFTQMIIAAVLSYLAGLVTDYVPRTDIVLGLFIIIITSGQFLFIFKSRGKTDDVNCLN